ncbi:hypothetical protein [Escherichia coli]|uniref:hypothetical protein n=1 Tax=Escherichia coli TaxID=562 RepID=UPI0020236F01|nr:hypothetical protein [Escherichia coli]
MVAKQVRQKGETVALFNVAKSERVNDRKITADGKEGPGDRSGEAYPCINASPAKMEARHSPHTTLRPHN